MNPLNETLTSLEAEQLWSLKIGAVSAACRQGHIEARMSAGTWLTTRSAMTARYGPQPPAFAPEDDRSEWLKTHQDDDLGLEARG